MKYLKNELVTVCVTTYNRKELLSLTLKSILNQTYKNIEILIIDDYSTDGTQELIENKLLKLDDRINYIRNNKNKGLASGRNTAIFNAKGKYFTFCDDDDEWEKNFIEEFVNIAEKYNENWCFCCGTKQGNDQLIPSFKGKLKNIIYQGYTPPVASQFYYLSSIKKINGYNEKVKSGVDHDLWLRLSSVNMSICTIEKALALPNINFSNNSMTTNENKRINGIKDSLIEWELLIVDSFSKEFYKFFKANYMYYLYKRFFISNLKEKNVMKMIYFFYKFNKLFFIKDLKRYILRRIKQTKYNMGPLFFNFYYKKNDH